MIAYVVEEGCAKLLTIHPLKEGQIEDDVVQQHDAYDFTRRFELGGDVDVALRRFNTAAGVVVGHDDR